MPRTVTHRNIKPKDRRHMSWYTDLESELQRLICPSGNGVTLRQNKGSSCFVGPGGRPVFELVCVGTAANDVVFGVEKDRADGAATLTGMPWSQTFNVMPVNAGDATFYRLRLPADAPARRLRIEKLIRALGLEGDGDDDLGAAIDAL